MRRFAVLAIKFVTAWVSLYFFFGWTDYLSVSEITGMSLVVGVIGYIIGELVLLPRVNNTVATVADFGLAAVLIGWMVTQWHGISIHTFTVSMILGSAVFIAVGEWMLHVYYQRRILKRPI